MNSGPSTKEIRRNLEEVRDRIAAAATRGGRDPAGVKLVAVTKGQPVEVIRRGYAAGLRLFGENRVEEALSKLAQLTDLPDVEWHMVGHIQSRKASKVAPAFEMVQSVDRVKIARLLDKNLESRMGSLTILLQCNVSGEESKSGWELLSDSNLQSALDDFRIILGLERLNVRGLMTMAPWTQDHQTLRKVFSRLREILAVVSRELGVAWRELSMGMTDDFEIAVEEGATIVRIGRAIFGPREM